MENGYEPSAEEIQTLVDGELSSEAAARVRSALLSGEGGLAELGEGGLAELDECLQMAALAHALRDEIGLVPLSAVALDGLSTTRRGGRLSVHSTCPYRCDVAGPAPARYLYGSRPNET